VSLRSEAKPVKRRNFQKKIDDLFLSSINSETLDASLNGEDFQKFMAGKGQFLRIQGFIQGKACRLRRPVRARGSICSRPKKPCPETTSYF